MGFKQRWLHYYALNETLHTAFLLWLFTDAVDFWGEAYSSSRLLFPLVPAIAGYELPRMVKACLCYVVGFWSVFAVMMVSLWVRRSLRRTRRLLAWSPRYPDPVVFRTLHTTTPDGVTLTVRTSELVAPRRAQGSTQQQQQEQKKQVMLLCAPLGQCGPSCYTPIMMTYGTAFVYVTWDYRGLFGSGGASDIRRLSIPFHARDALCALAACGYSYADVVVGHSMGAAVGLELAISTPASLGCLVSINGFHGHVFQTAFQPLVRLPFAADATALFVETLLARPFLLESSRRLFMPLLKFWMPRYASFFGSPLLRQVAGDAYYLDIIDNYFGTLCKSQDSVRTYLRLFQELDAHSVYHLLPNITHPVLIISGFLDCLSPAMQSAEMARRIPHAVHFCDPFSTHFSIVESPEWCAAEIEAFLADAIGARGPS
jgi:3-oxoadipate enol-lactonase